MNEAQEAHKTHTNVLGESVVHATGAKTVTSGSAHVHVGICPNRLLSANAHPGQVSPSLPQPSSQAAALLHS